MKSRKLILSLTFFVLSLCVMTVMALFREPLFSSASSRQNIGQYYYVPVFCFHNIDGPGPYSMTRQEFRTHMQILKEEGIEVVSLKTLYEHSLAKKPFQKPVVVITVDDDYANSVRIAAPILREFNFPAAFFVYINNIFDEPKQGMSWDDLRRLRKEGFEIQNHSYTHTVFHRAKGGESMESFASRVDREVIASTEAFKKNMPDNPQYTFAYPMGLYSPYLEKRLLDAGYKLLLTTDARPVDLSENFDGKFHRYTIHKLKGANPTVLFRRYIAYSKKLKSEHAK